VAACIAAASVIAKVTRDRLMRAMHDEFPAYGFAEHKGYVTPDHQSALAEYGPCAQHRRSFVNVVRAAGGCAQVRLAIPDDDVRLDDVGIGGVEAGDVEADMIELRTISGPEVRDNGTVRDVELTELVKVPVEVP
jgi:hypothetical protein